MKLRPVVFGLVATLALTAAALAGCRSGEPAAAAPAEETSGSPPSSEAQLAAAAWDNFLALNQPLTGDQPKAWESWKQTSAVYLSDGSMPLPWGQDPPLPAEVEKQAKAMGLDLTRPFHDLDTEIQVDGLALADRYGQNVRYQLLMNRATFDYILDNGFYNVNGQEEAARKGEPLKFPSESSEIKTAYVFIPDETAYKQLVDKFYIVNAYYRDGGGYRVGRAALTGMHVIDKSRPNWVWTTFENVNNPDFTVTNTQPPGPQRYDLPISSAVQTENDTRREALRQQGSIFAEYRLNGVQVDFVDGDGKATLLASSQIESAFQHSSSCITCHGTASYSVAEGYFPLTEMQDGGIVYYTGDLPEKKLEGYNSLDFVWSLKRASRKR